MKRFYGLGARGVLAALAVVAVYPAVDRLLAARLAQQDLRALKANAFRQGLAAPIGLPLLALQMDPPLASWGNIGGCGASGGSGTPGGGLKWVGRNVTGGLVDAQVIASQSSSRGSDFSTLSARLATELTPRLRLAATLPVLYKTGEVSVLGISRTAKIAGFGDANLELTAKLGAIGSHQLSLIGAAPTGASDAVREGVILPQHLQLGGGVPGATVMYEHTRDRDWGLLLMGGTLTYNRWENNIGDARAPSATAYAHAGYLWGPFVPSAGLTVFGKASRDRERGSDRLAASDPRFMLMPSVGLEWSSELVAVMSGFIVGLSPNGVQSLSLGLGVSSSLF